MVSQDNEDTFDLSYEDNETVPTASPEKETEVPIVHLSRVGRLIKPKVILDL